MVVGDSAGSGGVPAAVWRSAITVMVLGLGVDDR